MINGLFVVLTWLLAAVATFGPVAVILGLIFAPAVAVPLISSIASRLFACTRCIMAIVAVLMCIGSYWVGHWDAAADCRAGEMEAQLRNARIDADNAKKSADDEITRANTIEASANDQHAKDLDYIKSLESRPACVLDDGDIGSVRPGKSRPRFTKPSTNPR